MVHFRILFLVDEFLLSVSVQGGPGLLREGRRRGGFNGAA